VPVSGLFEHLKIFFFLTLFSLQPLPAKHTILGQLDRYSKEFVTCRMILLERFLSRLVCHPILSEDKHLKVFLTANATVCTYIYIQFTRMISKYILLILRIFYL